MRGATRYNDVPRLTSDQQSAKTIRRPAGPWTGETKTISWPTLPSAATPVLHQPRLRQTRCMRICSSAPDTDGRELPDTTTFELHFSRPTCGRTRQVSPGLPKWSAPAFVATTAVLLEPPNDAPDKACARPFHNHVDHSRRQTAHCRLITRSPAKPHASDRRARGRPGLNSSTGACTAPSQPDPRTISTRCGFDLQRNAIELVAFGQIGGGPSPHRQKGTADLRSYPNRASKRRPLRRSTPCSPVRIVSLHCLLTADTATSSTRSLWRR